MTRRPPGPDRGETLAGRYRFGNLIGEGSLGRVWKGTDDFLARDVAIKELLCPPGMRNADWMELRHRVIQEARTAGKLSHPSIVTTYDVIEADERPWIIMQLVNADSLTDIIDMEGPLPPHRVARLALQLVEALAEAHIRGVAHRDVKPSNVLVTPSPERAVLTDFGIAVLNGDATLARTGVFVGSPTFMAPEVAGGKEPGPASDLWSLGATLYTALAGQPPFRRSGQLATLAAIVSEEAPELPSAGLMRPVLEGLLRKDPEQRMTSAEVWEILRQLVDRSGETVEEPVPAGGDLLAPAPHLAEASDKAPSEPEEPLASRAGRRRETAATSVSGPGTAPDLRARRWLAGLVAVVGLVIAISVGGTLIAPNASPPGSSPPSVDTNNPIAAGAQPDTSASPSPSSSSSPSASPTPSASPDQPEAAEGLRYYQDETGFSLRVPQDWTIVRDNSSVYFLNPEGGYLQVDQTNHPGTDARSNWEELERAIAAGFPDYQRVSIDYVYHPNLTRFDTAADWEFTYTSQEHGPMRAVNRAFHTSEHGYALFLTGPQEQWAPTNHELMEEFTSSFEPAN